MKGAPSEHSEHSEHSHSFVLSDLHNYLGQAFIILLPSLKKRQIRRWMRW